jgi:hypothetical protein
MPKTNNYSKDLDLSGIIRFKRSWWMQTGKYIRDWISGDGQEGILQGKKQTDTYKSEQYKKYKNNYMKRLTDGKKLKAVKGQSVKNNNTSRVTMTLTGQLFRGLRPKNVVKSGKTILGVLMSYLEKDSGKIEGNERYGRDVRNLNRKNLDKLVKRYEDESVRQIKKFYAKKEVIKI